MPTKKRKLSHVLKEQTKTYVESLSAFHQLANLFNEGKLLGSVDVS